VWVVVGAPLSWLGSVHTTETRPETDEDEQEAGGTDQREPPVDGESAPSPVLAA